MIVLITDNLIISKSGKCINIYSLLPVSSRQQCPLTQKGSNNMFIETETETEKRNLTQSANHERIMGIGRECRVQTQVDQTTTETEKSPDSGLQNKRE